MEFGYLEWTFLILTVSLLLNAWVISGWLEKIYLKYFFTNRERREI